MLRQTFHRARRPFPTASSTSLSLSLRQTRITPLPSTTIAHRHDSSSSSSTPTRPPLPQSYAHDTLLTNRKILIANRGEISIRIARAAKALGAKSVAVCAPEDVDSPHVAFADEYVVLEKGSTAIAPYLDIEGLTNVAVERGVDLVHPGEFRVCVWIV